MDGGLQLGIAALGHASPDYLRWRVRGDELHLFEGEAAVRLRLGGEPAPHLTLPIPITPALDYFRALAGWHFETNAEASWLCFLSRNEVVLRLSFSGGPVGALLEPLVAAACGWRDIVRGKIS